MLHFRSRSNPFYLTLLVECFLFCINFLALFREVIIDIWEKDTSAASIFGTLFFGSWFLAALWAAAELLFQRHILLTDGSLVLRRGVWASRKIPFDAIIRLVTREEQIEYSARTSWQTCLLYGGEKLSVITKDHKVEIHSIWLKDYLFFRNTLRQLAVHATLHGNVKFKERTSHFALLMGGLFILMMSCVNLFG